MPAFAGLHWAFRRFKKDRDHGVRFHVFREEIAAAVLLDFVCAHGKSRSVQFERPGQRREPHAELCWGSRILPGSCPSRKKKQRANNRETGFHSLLQGTCLVLYSTRLGAAGEEADQLTDIESENSAASSGPGASRASLPESGDLRSMISEASIREERGWRRVRSERARGLFCRCEWRRRAFGWPARHWAERRRSRPGARCAPRLGRSWASRRSR